MARLEGSICIANVATGTAAKTILQLIAPANHRLALKNVKLSSRGVTASDPAILIEIVRQTTAGTMTSLTPKKLSDLSATAETLQATAQHTATVEPTTTDILDTISIPAAGGAYIWSGEIVVPGGGRVALRATTGTTQNVDASMGYEE